MRNQTTATNQTTQKTELARIRQKEYFREYYQKNKAQILAHQKEYYELHGKEKKKQYFQDNKYTLCNKTLNHYCFKKMETAKKLHAKRVSDYLNRYPYDKHIEKYIAISLYKKNIFPTQGRYADCFSAGTSAYLYGIHRCAEMSYKHPLAYIKKVIQIYIICAIIVYDDSKNLCDRNGFRKINIDSDPNDRRY